MKSYYQIRCEWLRYFWVHLITGDQFRVTNSNIGVGIPLSSESSDGVIGMRNAETAA